MKRLSRLLNEVKGEKAHREAVAMGLKYKGFGYWQDPSTGKVAYKTENDQLVKVEPDVESELGDMSNKPDAPQANDGAVADMATSNQMQQPEMPAPPPVGSQVLGAPEPGEELVPSTLEWEPGPDGSTCVDSDDPPGKIPEDSYVSRTNNLKWGAGPDGTNYSNIDYRDLLKDLRSPNLDSFLGRMDTQSMMGRLKEGQTFISQFLEQAPMAAGMGVRSAADEAKQAGLTYSGYGYWKDNTGQVVAQTVDNQLQYIDQQMGTGTTATTDMGNPTSTASGQTPASKARSMGLVSDGSGSYKDAEGNTIARTVNNELVFYDSRAGGGAVSDGSGGAMITQSAPSWVDPVTGLIVVPPAQPESPEEINAVPDAVPATAPAGYDAFVNKKKKEMYRDNYIQTEIQQDIDAKQSEVDDIYIQNPASEKFYREMLEKIDGAATKGTDSALATAAIAQRNLEDNADTYVGYFNAIPAEEHEVLSQNLRSMLIKDAQAEYFKDNEDADPKFELASVRASQLQDNIDDLLDKYEQGVTKFPKPRKTPKNIESGNIKYNLEPFALGEMDTYLAKAANEELRNMGSEMRVDRVKPPTVLDVEWDVKGTDDKFEVDDNKAKLGKQGSRRAALDALKGWRTEVLPRLSPGQLLHAEALTDEDQGETARDNQRMRIYQLAGFGENSTGASMPGMYAIVVADEDGTNRLVPIFPTEKQREVMGMNEDVLAMLDGKINIQEEWLIGDFLGL